MLIPYNNKMFNVSHTDALMKDFVNPDILRWELHRVWVVDATLHPGNRNVLARRKLYFDEDTWLAMLIDGWDAIGSIYHMSLMNNVVLLNRPGTVYANNFIFNLQTGDYVSLSGTWADAPFNIPWTFNRVAESEFNPQTMAAAANY